MSERRVLAERITPQGVRVVLFEDTWLGHILDAHSGHAELEPHLDAVLEAIASPDHREREEWPGGSDSSSVTSGRADG